MNLKSSPCSCLNLRRASKALTDVYDKYLMPTSLSISQYAILRHIYQLAPINVSDLSVALRLDRTTLVRTLKPLEEKNYVEDIAKERARNRELRLTKEGENIFLKAHEYWEKAQSELTSYLGKEDADKFAELLEKVERYNA